MGPNPVRKGNLDTDTHAGMTEEKTERENDHLQAEERGLEQILLSWPSEGTSSDGDTLTLDFQPPEL